MSEVRYYSFKVREKFDLDKIAEYFKQTRPMKWTEFILIDNALVETVMKRSIRGHQIYLFEFGVLTFVNFYEDEMREFLSFLNQIEPVDYDSFAKYYEHYEVQMGEYGEVLMENMPLVQHKQLVEIIAELTAKSVGLAHVEDAMTRLMDQVEPMLIQMSNGQIKINRRTKNVLGEIIFFKYKLVQSVKLFEKPNASGMLREWSDSLQEHFELSDRYVILNRKSDDLKQMLIQYYKFNHSLKERRLYLFEVLLLASFPLASLIQSGRMTSFIKWIMSLL